MEGTNASLGNCSHGSPPDGVSVPRAVLFGVPACVIIVVTVVGNFLVLCFRAKVGKRQTTMLIWNLGLADFLVGVVVLPMGITAVISGRWPFGTFLCRLWAACDVIFCTASIVTLCTISVDRYIGVTRPLRYKSIVTRGRVLIAIICIWIFAISILLATIRYTPVPCRNPHVCLVSNELKYVVHSVISAFFFPALVTLGLYYKIFMVAKRRERGLREGVMLMTRGSNFLGSCLNAEPLRVHRGKMNAQKKIIKMHKKASLTLGVVVAAFLLCWCPFFCFYLINYTCYCVPLLLLDTLSWLGYCNSMVNPIIYAFTVQEFSSTLRSLTQGPAHGIASLFGADRTSRIDSRSAISRPICSLNPHLRPHHLKPNYGTIPDCQPPPSRKTSFWQALKDNRISRTIIRSDSSSLDSDDDSPHEASQLVFTNKSVCKEEPTCNNTEEVALDEGVWSAKLYTVLVDSRITGL